MQKFVKILLKSDKFRPRRGRDLGPAPRARRRRRDLLRRRAALRGPRRSPLAGRTREQCNNLVKF